MSCLSSLEKTVHSLITEYPLGKGYPNFHVTAFALIPLVGAYLYYREYKNPPTNPNKIFLPDPRKTAIKFSDKTVSLVEKTQEKAMSFLPETPPEKVKISPDTILKVQENAELKNVVLESVKLAFENKFIEAKANLDWFKKDFQCSPEEMQEISRQVDIGKQFIDQLEIISSWSPLGNFYDKYTIEDCIAIAKMAWKEAMQKPEKNKKLVSFFNLVEIGLSKGWFELGSKNVYTLMCAEVITEVDNRLEKTWMCHLMNRVYNALGMGMFKLIDIEIPENAKADEALSYLCRLAKYFHRLGSHDVLLQQTFDKIFFILSQNPIDIDQYSNIFTLILSCLTDQQLDARNWALRQMKESILANEQETPSKKIQLLLVIQSDYKTLGYMDLSDATLDRIIELINRLPQEEKKPWVEKTALALYKLQLYEKADQLIEKHNESIEEVADRIPLIQSVFLGVLALSTLFVRPFYPLCASVLVPLIPTVMWHRT